MARITINCEEDLADMVKQRAALRRQSVSGYISLLIAHDLGLPTFQLMTGLAPASKVLQAVIEEPRDYHAAPMAGKGAKKQPPRQLRG